MSSDLRAGFERALAEDRYDRLTRLAYADWLEEGGLDDEAAEQRRMATPEWAASDRWMHDFASKCGQTCLDYLGAGMEWREVTYEDVVGAGWSWVNRGEWGWDGFTQIGSEDARDLMSSFEVRAEYWEHWQVITGHRVEPDPEWGWDSPFSCSC